MTEIVLKEDDRVEWALKAFKRKVQRSGVLKDKKQKQSSLLLKRHNSLYLRFWGYCYLWGICSLPLY